MTLRKAEREDQLLETATRLFKEQGYHNTSITSQEIAATLSDLALHGLVKPDT